VIFPSIIDRYVFREICASFVFCFSVFLVTGLVAGFLPLLQKGMEAGLQLTLILFQVLIHALPSTLATVLPLSITIGVLLGLGRMAADNEIAALKSSGISILRLFPPVLLLGFIGLGLSLLCTLYLIPRGISEGRRLTREALVTRAEAGIEEHTFFDSLKGLIVYVDTIDPETRIMHRVFIREASDPDDVRTIIAKRGKSFPDPEGKAFVLHLRDGTILRENRRGDLTGSLIFESYIFRYPIERAGLNDSVKSFEELSMREIVERVDAATKPKETDTPETLAYYARVRTMAGLLITQRFTHPMACLALAVLSFPLGVINMGRSRLNNVSLGLIAIFAYYTVTLATERAARSGLAPPELVLPLTPVIFVAGSSYLIRCATMERLPRFMNAARRLILQARGQAS
jgi:lipopolysaccharide export system permease protein